MDIPSTLSAYLNHPVAVLGCGVSGQAVCAWLDTAGADYKVFDAKAADAERDFSSVEAKQCRLVVFSPGFSPEHPWLQTARDAGCDLLNELDFGSLLWFGQVIAITGTNGKSTLTEFLTTAFERSGVDAIACGNIGYPLTRLHAVQNMSRTYAVCEISSFQAESLWRFRCEALLWTNFDEDHLDRYASMREYFEAKWRLVERLEGTTLIVGESVANAARQFGYELPSFTQVISAQAPSADTETTETCAFRRPPQRENYLIARAFWESQGLSLEALEDAAEHFELPRHRLEFVASVSGVDFFNDSKATNFQASLAAMDTFRRPVFWIGGGCAKGGDITGFAERAASRVAAGYVLGEVATGLVEVFSRRERPCRRFDSMEQAVFAAGADAAKIPGSIVLLSPGFASFGLFNGYADRGKAFEKAVLSLKAGEAENIGLVNVTETSREDR